MDFHLIPPHGEAVLIVSTDGQGRIVTPLQMDGANSSKGGAKPEGADLPKVSPE